jgi:hypothetical protein
MRLQDVQPVLPQLNEGLDYHLMPTSGAEVLLARFQVATTGPFWVARRASITES